MASVRLSGETVTPVDDPILELSALLADLGATPVLVHSRLAPSTLYDVDYHIAMIACAFVEHASSKGHDRRRILAPWLKLLQFVAARPQLATDFRQWAGCRRDNLEAWSKMPRGYLGDRMHDASVEFLTARAVFVRDGDMLVESERCVELDAMAAGIRDLDMFRAERETMASLKSVRSTRAALGGQ